MLCESRVGPTIFQVISVVRPTRQFNTGLYMGYTTQNLSGKNKAENLSIAGHYYHAVVLLCYCCIYLFN